MVKKWEMSGLAWLPEEQRRNARSYFSLLPRDLTALYLPRFFPRLIDSSSWKEPWILGGPISYPAESFDFLLGKEWIQGQKMEDPWGPPGYKAPPPEMNRGNNYLSPRGNILSKQDRSSQVFTLYDSTTDQSTSVTIQYRSLSGLVFDAQNFFYVYDNYQKHLNAYNEQGTFLYTIEWVPESGHFLPLEEWIYFFHSGEMKPSCEIFWNKYGPCQPIAYRTRKRALHPGETRIYEPITLELDSSEKIDHWQFFTDHSHYLLALGKKHLLCLTLEGVCVNSFSFVKSPRYLLIHPNGQLFLWYYSPKTIYPLHH